MGLLDTRTGRWIAHGLLIFVPMLGVLGLAECLAWASVTVPLSENRSFQGLERALDCAGDRERV